MSHEITSTDSMMYVGERPWHGLGTGFPAGTRFTSHEAMVAAGLDWEVFKQPGIWRDSKGQVRENPKEFTNYRQIKIDGEEVDQWLGTVGENYTIVQNTKAFEFFDPFIENGDATFHTAGSLKGGSIVWVLAELNREPMAIRADDTVRKFLLLSHSHDGSRALRIGFTPIRVVCWNTLSAATSAVHKSKRRGDVNEMLRIKHTEKVLDAMKLVRETINLADQRFEATAEVYRKLAAHPISRTDLQKYVLRILCTASPGANPEKPSGKMKSNVEDVLGLIPTMKGGYDGTLWGAYNLVTEFLTWKRSREDDTRLSDLWLGGVGGQMNVTALDMACELLAA